VDMGFYSERRKKLEFGILRVIENWMKIFGVWFVVGGCVW